LSGHTVVGEQYLAGQGMSFGEGGDTAKLTRAPAQVNVERGYAGLLPVMAGGDRVYPLKTRAFPTFRGG